MADRHPYDRGFTALAHRGGYVGPAGAALENTLESFVRAREFGFRFLETDVHVTADGVLVAFHDDDLARVTQTRGSIARLPWRAVRDARVGGAEEVPRFDELLEALPDCTFNVDLKADGAVDPLVRAVEAHRAHARLCVGSFNTARLRKFRRLSAGRVATSVSPLGVAWFATPIARRLGAPAGVAVQVPARTPRGNLPLVTRGFVDACHRAERVVHVWTINDPAEMNRLLDLGVDGLVSDDLLALRGVLQRRGLWREP